MVERFGKFSRVLTPGLNLLIPVLEEIKYVQSLKEIALEIPSQSAVTHDNVTLHLDGVLYLKVVDAYKVWFLFLLDSRHPPCQTNFVPFPLPLLSGLARHLLGFSCALSPLDVQASYGVEDAEYAVTQLAQTTMRSELGKIDLDQTFKERHMLNLAIVEAMNTASSDWGIRCLRYEIRMRRFFFIFSLCFLG